MLSLKDIFVKHENRIILFLGVILLSLISYGVGRLGAPKPKEQVIIEAGAQEFFKDSEPKEASSNSVASVKKDETWELPTIIKEQQNSIQAPANLSKPDAASANNVGESKNQGLYVASKNGAKYHLPTCSGAKRIKEENKIWFNSKQEAEKAGYEPAKNCKGI